MDTTARYRLVGIDELRDGLEHLPVIAMPERSGRRRAA
jgi:hypothetical protein